MPGTTMVLELRINRSLEQCVDAWNNHGIRTEHHHSPKQLFSSGVLRLQHSGLVALNFMDAVDSDYGTDCESPAPLHNDASHVACIQNHAQHLAICWCHC